MKSIASLILVALAVAEASYIPYAHQGYDVAPMVTYGNVHYGAPTVVQSKDPRSWSYSSAIHHAHPAPIVSTYNHYDGHNYAGQYIPAAVTYNSGHYFDNYYGHHEAAAVIASPVQHSASYVAANRGAVHKAPLAGHAVNQKSLNLAPAPGTW